MDKTGLKRLWANITALVNTKVDKIEGKNLSTNDFTDEYKNKLDNLDDSETIQEMIKEYVDETILGGEW
jgi:hypothetical protein